MAKQIFVNLPVKDLAAAQRFWGELGFSFDAQFTDENAACLVIGENIYAMLLTEQMFATFTQKELIDAHKSVEALIALSADSRAEVDELADKALAAGGAFAKDPMDLGFMYGRSFLDPDGHHWEVFHMDKDSEVLHMKDM